MSSKFWVKTFIVLAISFSSALIWADATENVLAELSNAHGVSGFEKPVRKILEKQWKEQGINFEIDGMGNLVGKFSSYSAKKPTILVMAHMDEVGFLVTQINENGFLRVQPLGAWVTHVVWSQKWVIGTGSQYITAISGMDPPHVLADEFSIPPVDFSKMFLDTGLNKKDLQAMGIRPGLPVTPATKFQVLKANKRYAGKAFDDRAMLAVILDLMKYINSNKELLEKVNVVFAATVQEEVGMRGAQTVYASLKPDLVLNLEAGIAKDYPTQFTEQQPPKLGGGPTVFIYDWSMLPNPNLVAMIAKTAKNNKIPMQWESEYNYGQDASRLQSSGQGMPAVNIGIPIRYAHSHIGIIDRDDYNNTVKLLAKVISSLDTKTIKAMR
ncbi:MAG: M42 family metallopeptidase [Lentisphaerae bacterium]|nr:M42 family metallopeptidase [Lentisphaerota bacterium]MCP4101102.1 M42 family metallopeptidase [Lentisphaerota bacterium]